MELFIIKLDPPYLYFSCWKVILALLDFLGSCFHSNANTSHLKLNFTEELHTRPFMGLQKWCGWNTFALGNKLKFHKDFCKYPFEATLRKASNVCLNYLQK